MVHLCIHYQQGLPLLPVKGAVKPPQTIKTIEKVYTDGPREMVIRKSIDKYTIKSMISYGNSTVYGI